MQLRPYQPETDVYQVAAILSQSSPEPILPEEMQRREAQPIPEIILQRTVALQPDGTVAGYANTTHLPFMPDGRFSIRVAVDRAHQRMGTGSLLFDVAMRFAREAGATSLEAFCREDDQAAVRFAAKRGFAVTRQNFTSALDLATFDENPFTPALASSEARGLRFTTYAALGDSPATRQMLYDLEQAVSLDFPGNEHDFPPFPVWERLLLGAPWFRPEGVHLALDGDAWVGLSILAFHPDEGSHYLTGVLRSHRGQGLATALKLLAIRSALAAGISRVKTQNDSENEPMLAINRRMGYVPEPGDYWLVREKV